MDTAMVKREALYGKALLWLKLLYGATGLLLALGGAARHSAYTLLLSLGTLLVLPLLPGAWRLMRWERAAQMEFYILLFLYLSFSLGGAAEVYRLLPGYDKVVHCLSGTFVSMLALTLYLGLEKGRPRSAQRPATAILFVLFASMAIAGLFELCEYALAPIVGLDLQHVSTTGVTDTMEDMLVCLLGTLAFLPFIPRFFRGKTGPLTGAVQAFLIKSLHAEAM